MIPRSKAGWIAAVTGPLAVFLWVLTWTRPIGGDLAGTVRNLAGFLFVCSSLLIAYRWLKQRFMWRLRNRLIVTYIFIGVIPVLLLCLMAGTAMYLFAGQFAAFVVTSDLHAELKRLSAVNRSITTQILASHNVRKGMSLPAVASDPEAPDRQVAVYVNGELLATSQSTATPTVGPAATDETALVLDEGVIHLRAMRRVAVGADTVTVICSEPLTRERVVNIVGGMGLIDLYSTEPIKSTTNKDGVYIKLNGSLFEVVPRRSAGSLPEAAGWYDFEAGNVASLPGLDWKKGEKVSLLMKVSTRPSLLYRRFFPNLGDLTGWINDWIILLLAGVAIVFAIIEIAAIVIGVRLTRTMTKSVSELYSATQHINRGDFSHRIQVTSKDQLAALETSFNSMTESLEGLIAEQKEKQRIENDLAIAKEIQDLLFPHDITELEGLEVHGLCRPARTVSGDYYDFLPLGPTRLGLAVGDISGKGISAALLMATVHAFVRAYTLVEQVPALSGVSVGGGAARNGYGRRSTDSLPPGSLLAILNQQLYQSTPTEKYATMFLGFYDQTTRQLNYSNAGHLPPLVIGDDGHIRYLDIGGTVVGLFGEMTYPDASITMNPGDIFVAYSDGVTEPENDYGEFGAQRLGELIHDNRDLPLAEITNTVIGAVLDWIGGEEQPDDITLVLARAR